MAWGEKYKCEFADNLGLVWTIKIYEDGYSSTVTTLVATGNPLTFNYIGNSDDIYDPVIETEVKLRVWSSTNFALSDLYATEDMHFKVIITTPFGGGDVERFVGFVDCGNYEEPYEDVPYEVTITACCGLKFLKGIKYDDDGTPYNGRLLQSEIILDILAKVGFSTFTEFINIYEESMDDDTDDSIFDQVRIDVDLFKNMYCYDVLAEIVRTYGAVIRQMGTNHVIYRPVELKNATVYGRAFQSPTSKAGVSMTPQRYIDRSTHSSYLIQVRGGVKMIIPPAKKVTIHQDYGNKESWIDNWQFSGSSYDSSTYKFNDWTYPGSGVHSLIGVLKGEADGCVLPATTRGPGASPILSQTFGNYALAASDIFIIEFEYFVYSPIDAQNVSIAVKIKADNSNHWLYPVDDKTAGWSGSLDWIDPLTAIGANIVGEWQTFRRQITSLPTAGSYTIGLYNGTSSVSNAFWGIKNIKFFATNDNITSQMVRKTFDPIPDADSFLKKVVNAIWRKKKWVEEKMYNDLPEVVQHDWVKENAINGTEIEYDMLLGDVTKSGDGGVNIDNVIEQFSGALICNERTLLQVVHTVTLVLVGITGTANITCNGVTRLAEYNISLSQTAANFVTDHYAAYTAVGITVTSSGEDIIFTGTAGDGFTGNTTIVTVSGDLTGNVIETQPDTYSDATSYTTNWNSRGGSESKELGSILVDEMAAQYARPKQLIQMALRDQNPDRAEILTYIFGCYEDDLNKYSGNNRKFVVGRGSFEVKERFLMIDLKEVI